MRTLEERAEARAAWLGARKASRVRRAAKARAARRKARRPKPERMTHADWLVRTAPARAASIAKALEARGLRGLTGDPDWLAEWHDRRASGNPAYTKA